MRNVSFPPFFSFSFPTIVCSYHSTLLLLLLGMGAYHSFASNPDCASASILVRSDSSSV
jgi:hypothetical protein